MNRVNQIYNTESAIKLVLIADTDKLNLEHGRAGHGRQRPVRLGPVLHVDSGDQLRAARCSTATGS